MKAYQVIENGKPLEERTLETPEPKGREVVLKTVACGVCHSDVHIHDGYFDLGGGVQLPSPLPGGEPLTMGHEIFGEVSAIGDEVEGINVGERYVAYPWMGCGDCDLCDDDMTHYCANNSNLGIHVAGGYGDHVLVPDQKYLFAKPGQAVLFSGWMYHRGLANNSNSDRRVCLFCYQNAWMKSREDFDGPIAKKIRQNGTDEQKLLMGNLDKW